MANLHRHLCLMESPAVSAVKLRRYVTEAAVGDCVTIALRPHVLLPDLGAEVLLRRDVIVTMGAGPSYWVSWEPSDNGPFPRLTGALEVVDDPPCSRLVMTGDIAVQRSVIGHRINQAIAKDLLSYLSRQIA